MPDYQRRKTDMTTNELDKTEQKILELIELTTDTKDKAFLLILLKLNNSLSDNTNVVHAVADKLDSHLRVFEQHAEDEFAEYHKQEGIKKIGVYVLGAIQSIAIAMIIYFQAELISIHSTVNELKIQNAVHAESIKRNTIIINDVIGP